MDTVKNFERLERSRVKLTITVTQADCQKEYEALRSDYSKKIHIDGFRAGKVPAAVLERKLGDALRLDAMSHIIEKAMEEALQGAELKPIMYSMPELAEKPDFSLEADFTFSVLYDTFPEVKVTPITGLSIEVPVVEISKEDEQREIDALRERNALVVDKASGAKASKGDVATISYKELDDTGTPIEGSAREDFVFEVGSLYNIYELDDEVIGMKVGDTKTFEKKFPEDFKYKEIAGTKKKIELSLSGLKEKKLPDLDDEFAQDVSEKFKTLNDLKADIRQHLEKQLESKIKSIKEKAIVDALLEKAEIDLPASMVEAEIALRWEDLKKRMNVQDDAKLESILSMSGKSRASLYEEWRPNAERAIKTRMVLDKMVADGKYEATEEDFAKEYERAAAENSMSVDEVKEEYKKREMVEYLSDHIKEEKLFAHLLSQATLKKAKKTSFMDFFSEKE
jgi:trigger factor